MEKPKKSLYEKIMKRQRKAAQKDPWTKKRREKVWKEDKRAWSDYYANKVRKPDWKSYIT